MRVWILEDTPDYESTTRHGLFAQPGLAWDSLFELVQKKVFAYRVPFSLYVGGDKSVLDPKDPTRPIVLSVRYQAGDMITLSGESVKGSPRHGYPPSVENWRDLQQVGGLLRMHAEQATGYECTDEVPNHLATGTWNFRHAG